MMYHETATRRAIFHGYLLGCPHVPWRGSPSLLPTLYLGANGIALQHHVGPVNSSGVFRNTYNDNNNLCACVENEDISTESPHTQTVAQAAVVDRFVSS